MNAAIALERGAKYRHVELAQRSVEKMRLTYEAVVVAAGGSPNFLGPFIDLFKARGDVQVFCRREPLSTGQIDLGNIERGEKIVADMIRVESRVSRDQHSQMA